MHSIAEDETYHCLDPILLVIGETPPDEVAVNAYVFHREGDVERLHRGNTGYESER
ncbi:hypothetical protein [Halocatena marina]|uniref:Uncharacterized protein n=1 Tax=Halocatena marina TaxID=2934937 RepID=A0ABD5YV82_9EURY|nr:hypothetical protein [Halocatena marina]